MRAPDVRLHCLKCSAYQQPQSSRAGGWSFLLAVLSCATHCAMHSCHCYWASLHMYEKRRKYTVKIYYNTKWDKGFRKLLIYLFRFAMHECLLLLYWCRTAYMIIAKLITTRDNFLLFAAWLQLRIPSALGFSPADLSNRVYVFLFLSLHWL